jgi:hypothetical protein
LYFPIAKRKNLWYNTGGKDGVEQAIKSLLLFLAYKKVARNKRFACFKAVGLQENRSPKPKGEHVWQVQKT